MKTYPITLGDKTYEVVQHDDGTFEMPSELKRFDGHGTALKPAVECWWLVRKPIEESTIAAQVLATGTGGINIDATRVKHANAEDLEKHVAMVTAIKARGGSMKDSWKNSSDLSGANDVKTEGRWPANLVLTHSPECRQVGTQTVPAPVINRFDDGMKPFGNGAGHSYTSSGGGNEEVPVFECAPGCPVAILDAQSGTTTSGAMKHEVPGYEGESDTPFLRGKSGPGNQHGGTGGASRFFNTFEPEYTAPFFYTGKASKKDKNADLEEEKLINKHPTVKAQSLMTHLVKLVTPPGGIVLDPFAGSGSTCVAALSSKMHFIGIEQEEEYLQIARARVRPAKDRAEVKMSQDSIFDLFVNGGNE